MSPSFARISFIAVLVTLFCFAGSASAATFDVNTTKDLLDAEPGDGTCAAEDDPDTEGTDETGLRALRACIMEANHLEGEDAINVPEGWYKLTIEPFDELDEEAGDLDITDPGGLTVEGTGDGFFTVIDANGIDRGVQLHSESLQAVGFGLLGSEETSASLVDLTIRNGFVDDGNDGGGVLAGESTDLTMTRSFVIHNAVTSGDGGGIATHEGSAVSLDRTTVERNATDSRGGGISSRSDSTTIESSSVSQNLADENGGGVWMKDNDSDSALNPVTISDSAVDNNHAEDEGGGVYVNQRISIGFPSDLEGDFEPPTEPALTVERSSVSNNSANDHGGGIYNESSVDFPCCGKGVGLEGKNGETEGIRTDIVNTTLSGNIADSNVSGGGRGGAIHNARGHVSILNATIVDGQSNYDDGSGGGAIFTSGSPVDLKNTILATSITRGSYDPCEGRPFTSNGNNLQTEDDGGEANDDCGFHETPGDGDKVNADPRLGRLQNNGGPTDTRALLAGSAAIDAANNDGCPSTDQRGVGRPPGNPNAGPNCDIGAYEVSSTPAEQPPPITPQQQQECTPAAPRSSISRNSLQIEDNTVKLTGRSTDQLCAGQDARGAIQRLRLAIGLDLGSQCRFLRRNGNLGARRDCDNRQFINARLGQMRNGKVPWTFRLRGLDLPNGVYDLVAFGVDSEGNAETRLRRFNHKRFRLR